MKKIFKCFSVAIVLVFLVVGVCFARVSSDTFTGTADGTALATKWNTSSNGLINVSVYGASWSGIVYLKKTFDNGATWIPVKTFAFNEIYQLNDDDKSVQYRFDAAIDSGSVNCRLSYR